jgi:peroxin-6
VPHSTILYPANRSAIQGLGSIYELASRNLQKGKATIEVRALDVVPIGLSAIYVSIESNIVEALLNEKGHTNGTAHLQNGHRKSSRAKPAGHNEEPKHIDRLLQGLVRRALSSLHIVHEGNDLDLPLNPHPITHVPPPPARITICEPIGQGLLLPDTKIIVTQHPSHGYGSHNRSSESRTDTSRLMVNGSASEDTFYSADESKALSENSESETETETEDDTEDTGDTDDNETGDDISDDDSLDGIISLNAPPLGTQTPTNISTFGPGSPYSRGRRTNGIGTPGSIASAYSMTSSGAPGKVFKTQGLLSAIPGDLLFPRPTFDEDEEIRVYVDVAALIRIGCFSGDWVRLEVANKFSMGSTSKPEWRAVKAYGLPETYSSGKHLSLPKSSDEIGSFRKPKETPRAFMSPILLSNLGSPQFLKIAALSPAVPPIPSATPSQRVPDQIPASATPPAAKEVTLLKLSTPLSTDRQFQQVLLTRLKHYFEEKRRVVKSGDLVGMSIDQNLAKTFFTLSGGEEEAIGDEILSNGAFSDALRSGVAWFRIGGVTPESDDDETDLWGGVYSIDPSSTRMVQAGSVKERIPGTASNTWQYYLGIKRLPVISIGTSQAKGHIHPSLTPVRPKVTILQRRLRELISATTSPRAIHMKMAPTAILLTSTQRGIGKASIAIQACTDVGIHSLIIDAFDILTDGGSGGGDVKTEAYLKARAERALACGSEFCAIVIRHVEALTADRMITVMREIVQESRIVIATATDVDKIPDGIRALFTHEIEQTAPDEGERQTILQSVVESKAVRLGSEVDLGGVAVKTAALVAGDLVDVVERAVRAKAQRIEALVEANRADIVNLSIRDIQLAGGEFANCVIKADFDTAVDAARKNFADSIGAPKIPNVPWDDVGGLTNVKDALTETIQLPLERPELFAQGMKKRSGILFYGPPGTGKTLLAKAIATEFSLNFFSVKGPELLNMYIGESEANVRRVFQRARDARPCVVFFDELDSVAPKRGNQGDSGGVMDRIVSQLLAELDGMSDGKEGGGGGVFVIGATNRPDLLDAALLRPGRFDKMLYLGVSDTHAKQLTILEAVTRKFALHPDISLEKISERLPLTYTGADLYALCSDAMLKAITRQANAVDDKIKKLPNGPVSTAYFFDHLATEEDKKVQVTEIDFKTAQEELVGSVR